MTEYSEYIGEKKASRLAELSDKGVVNLSDVEGSEYSKLMFEIVDWKEELGEFDILFEGKCRRCGREFSNPMPKITHPEGIHKIASHEWCADCNAFAMSMVHRETSAYRIDKKQLYDPLRGGRRDAG